MVRQRQWTRQHQGGHRNTSTAPFGDPRLHRQACMVRSDKSQSRHRLAAIIARHPLDISHLLISHRRAVSHAHSRVFFGWFRVCLASVAFLRLTSKHIATTFAVIAAILCHSPLHFFTRHLTVRDCTIHHAVRLSLRQTFVAFGQSFVLLLY